MPDNKKQLAEIKQAVAVIKGGGVVAFPTETYYGLAVDPFNEKALQRLFLLKKRPESNPILVIIPDHATLPQLVSSVPSCLLPFIALWPAPLTLVMPSLDSLSTSLTAGTNTVGVRISAHPVAQLLVKECQQPITATSANISGYKPCCSPVAVRQSLANVDFVINGGETPGGKASTLVGEKNNRPFLYRDGALDLSSLGFNFSKVR